MGSRWQIEFIFFFFQAEDGIRDVAVTGVQTCALPISHALARADREAQALVRRMTAPRIREGDAVELHGRHEPSAPDGDRKSTRLNSSHGYISYAVFCLKKKKKIKL